MGLVLAEWQAHGVFMAPIYRLCVQIDITIVVAVVAACAAVGMATCAAVAKVSVTAAFINRIVARVVVFIPLVLTPRKPKRERDHLAGVGVRTRARLGEWLWRLRIQPWRRQFATGKRPVPAARLGGDNAIQQVFANGKPRPACAMRHRAEGALQVGRYGKWPVPTLCAACRTTVRQPAAWHGVLVTAVRCLIQLRNCTGTARLNRYCLSQSVTGIPQVGAHYPRTPASSTGPALKAGPATRVERYWRGFWTQRGAVGRTRDAGGVGCGLAAWRMLGHTGHCNLTLQ